MESIIGAMRQGNQLNRKAAGAHLGQDSDVGRDGEQASSLWEGSRYISLPKHGVSRAWAARCQ